MSNEEIAAESIMTAAEYAEQVQNWLIQAHQWHILALGFPSYLAYQASLHQQQRESSTGVNNNYLYQRAAQQPQQPPPQPAEPHFEEYTIPQVWKRVMAEFIDFLILFVLKVVVTFIAVDWFELIDLDKYDYNLVKMAAGKEIDYKSAMEVTSDIVLLELIHRLVVCVFEALCTHKGVRGRPGGATPGKLVMGLRIFLCDQIVMTADPTRVQISPADDLGLFWATVRSVLKNMSLAFFFPVCFTLLFLPYNRTIYDLFSRSIVVEVQPQQRG